MFEIKGASVALEFQPGTILDGATVKCSLDLSIRDFVKLQGMISAISNSEDAEQIEETYREFARLVLREWDLGADGEPLPADGDGIVQLPFATANAILSAWTDAIGAKNPKPQEPSANGATSGAAFEQMVPA